jgi:hypothetical protein
MIRSMMIGAAAALAASVLASGGVAQAAHPIDLPPTDVPFETLGVVSASSGINLLEGSLVTVRDEYDVDATRDLLSTGYDDSFARQVTATIGEIPSDRVVLVGVIDSSCTPAKDAGLRRDKDGELVMFAPNHVPEPIECFVAVITVAVLSVDADDAPVGAGDGATLVEFDLTGFGAPAEPTAAELTDDDSLLVDILPDGARLPDLPRRDPEDRRFGFVRAGCANTTAEMIVTPQLLDARLGYDEHGLVVNCARAEFFLVVFDVPADLVRVTAQLAGA